jgi:hypothetical protein
MAVQRHPTHLCLSHPPVREGENGRIVVHLMVLN